MGDRVYDTVYNTVYDPLMRWKTGRRAGAGASAAASASRPIFRSGVVTSWCGMRGIVTLAAALALPDGFPERPLVLLTAFVVVVGTLIVQGLTLPPLLRWVDLRDDGPVEREVADARQATLRAALRTLDGDPSGAAKVLRFELQELLAEPGKRGADGSDAAIPALRHQAVAAARAELRRLRFADAIGDDAYHRIEVVLDRSELYAETSRTVGDRS